MVSRHNIELTSSRTGNVEDIPLSPEIDRPLTSENGEEGTTRRIARTQLVRNTVDPTASVKLTLMHQRRSATKPWEDADSFLLPYLNAGQEVRLILNCDETLRLFEALQRLYTIARSGVPFDAYMEELNSTGSDFDDIQFPPYHKKYLVVDVDKTHIRGDAEKASLTRLLESGGEELFNLIEELQPDLLQAAATARLLKQRRVIVQEFKDQLHNMEWSELQWDDFFKANKWIFGYGLDYRFLTEIQSQAHYGGTILSGLGGQRGDYLMATQAQNRFTVLVEIKKPNSELVTAKPYRNKAHGFSEDLIGGVAQLQSNCRTWTADGSRSDENRERLNLISTYTYEPKGILVIGHTKQLDTVNKLATFELFRRNLHNPQILTYDELYARAEFLVSHDVEAAKSTTQAPARDDDLDMDVDDIPF
jgi:hypothetical protein